MQSHGTREVSGLHNSFGFQSISFSLLAGLYPTGIVGQVCAYVISGVISSNLFRAHVNPPPPVDSPHLGSVGAMNSHSLGSLSTHNFLPCLW